jgi:hypothetical protein
LKLPRKTKLLFFLIEKLFKYFFREKAKREKKRNLATAPAGQKSLRLRIQAKKARARENSIG